MDGQHVLIEECKKDKSWPSDKIYPSFSQHSTVTHYQPSPPGQTGLGMKKIPLTILSNNFSFDLLFSFLVD